ncbi:MAG: hypothetical protein KBS95_07815 [Alistipes sp.]|nr:hypothetical protein [Candidatus Alistipes equi]
MKGLYIETMYQKDVIPTSKCRTKFESVDIALLCSLCDVVCNRQTASLTALAAGILSCDTSGILSVA